MIRTFSSKELEAKINGKINLKSVILKGFGYKHYRPYQLLNLKISENMILTEYFLSLLYYFWNYFYLKPSGTFEDYKYNL